MRVLLTLALVFGLVFSVNAQTATLKGRVYDANGSVIIRAKVKATNGSSKVFEATVNKYGEYKLELPFVPYNSSPDFRVSRYLIKVEAQYFESFEIKDFRTVPSYKGEMNLDFALDVQEIVDIIKMPKGVEKKKT